jgi:hypothetical protein
VGNEPECSRILEMGNFDRVGERQDYVVGGLGELPVLRLTIILDNEHLGRVSRKYKTFYTDLGETILQSMTRKSEVVVVLKSKSTFISTTVQATN